METDKINYLDGINCREDLTKLIDMKGYKTGIEIGVDRAKFSVYLLSNSKLDLLFSVDNWARCPECKDESFRVLSAFGSRSSIIVASSPLVAQQFSDNFFDFIYIDGNHKHDPFKADIEAFWPKLKAGGLFAGHDYLKCSWGDVVNVVDEFVKQYNLALYTTRESGPTKWDRVLSWYVFKPAAGS
jgi:hypothetical protein